MWKQGAIREKQLSAIWRILNELCYNDTYNRILQCCSKICVRGYNSFLPKCNANDANDLFIDRGYANACGTAWGIHSDIVMPYIAEYGTPEQIEKFIPAMAAGTNIGAIAMTEPGAGR